MTATRCRRCGKSVRVPSSLRHTKQEHTFALFVLDCGHVEAAVVHPGRSVRSCIRARDYECPDTKADAKPVRVLAVLSETEWVGLTDEQLSELVASAT
ncbi:MAG: hypothetical protein ABSD85_17085 [Acidimicrobiales bacterium]